jgi:hypothetical protein
MANSKLEYREAKTEKEMENWKPKRAALGMCWIGHQSRPYYAERIIKRGKFKGFLEVEVLVGAGNYKKVKIQHDCIKWRVDKC